MTPLRVREFFNYVELMALIGVSWLTTWPWYIDVIVFWFGAERLVKFVSAKGEEEDRKNTL